MYMRSAKAVTTARHRLPDIYRLAEAARQCVGLECENHSALKPRNRLLEDSHPGWFVQPPANCRNLGVASAIAESSFQLLTSGALIAI